MENYNYSRLEFEEKLLLEIHSKGMHGKINNSTLSISYKGVRFTIEEPTDKIYSDYLTYKQLPHTSNKSYLSDITADYFRLAERVVSSKDSEVFSKEGFADHLYSSLEQEGFLVELSPDKRELTIYRNSEEELELYYLSDLYAAYVYNFNSDFLSMSESIISLCKDKMEQHQIQFR